MFNLSIFIFVPLEYYVDCFNYRFYYVKTVGLFDLIIFPFIQILTIERRTVNIGISVRCKGVIMKYVECQCQFRNGKSWELKKIEEGKEERRGKRKKEKGKEIVLIDFLVELIFLPSRLLFLVSTNWMGENEP